MWPLAVLRGQFLVRKCMGGRINEVVVRRDFTVFQRKLKVMVHDKHNLYTHTIRVRCTEIVRSSCLKSGADPGVVRVVRSNPLK